jgi:hypothetical protein
LLEQGTNNLIKLQFFFGYIESLFNMGQGVTHAVEVGEDDAKDVAIATVNKTGDVAMKISGDVAQTIQVGEREVGLTSRQLIQDTAATIQIGERELGDTTIAMIDEFGEVVEVGERELGETVRNFSDDTADVVKTGEMWFGLNSLAIVGFPLIAVAGIALVLTSTEFNKSERETAKQAARAEIATAKAAERTAKQAIKAVEKVVDDNPEIAEEAIDMVAVAVDPATAVGI